MSAVTSKVKGVTKVPPSPWETASANDSVKKLAIVAQTVRSQGLLLTPFSNSRLHCTAGLHGKPVGKNHRLSYKTIHKVSRLTAESATVINRDVTLFFEVA